MNNSDLDFSVQWLPYEAHKKILKIGKMRS